MGQKKKPRNKVHKPKQIRVPSIIPLVTAAEAYPDLALSLHLRIESFIDRPTITSANQLSHQLCMIAGEMSHANNGQAILGRRDAHSIAINSAINAFQGICDRHERTGKVGVTALEAQTLIAASGRLDEILCSVPAVCYEKADRELDKALGIENAKKQEWKQRDVYPSRAERRAEVIAALGVA